MILPIPHTIALLIKCWEAAEVAIAENIDLNAPGANEESITEQIRAKLAEQFRTANNLNEFSDAFLADLNEAFPDLQNAPELTELANGLIAEVTWHGRSTEGTTGGDFGLLLVRPQVEDHDYTLRIDDYQRGLLAQAKLKMENGKWDELTTTQQDLLKERLAYTSLVLYAYEDKQRHKLSRFQWQNCFGYTIDALKTWKRDADFPDLQPSSRTIEALGNGTIGTDDRETIRKYIAPVDNSSLIITIRWPDGKPPGTEVHVYSSQQNQVVERVQVYE